MQKTSNFFKITLIYFISLVLFVGVRILFGLGIFNNFDSVFIDIFSTCLIQIGIMFLVPLLFYLLLFKKKPKEAMRNFGFTKISTKAVVICFLIGLIAFLLNIVVSSIFNGLIEAFDYEAGSGASSGAGDYSILSFIINVVLVAVLPAFCEEFLHRGVFMRGMFNSISVKHSLIISSICFGLMHLNIVQVFYAAILGLLIGFVSIVGKSIWPAIIIHFTNNFVNVYLSFAKANNWVFGNFYDAINSFINNNWVFAIIIIILVICAMLFLLLKLIMDLLKISNLQKFNKVISILRNTFKTFKEENPDTQIEDYEVCKELEPEIIEAMPIFKSETPSELFFQDKYPKEKLIFKDRIFLIGSLFLGTLITISTFIWGIL